MTSSPSSSLVNADTISPEDLYTLSPLGLRPIIAGFNVVLCPDFVSPSFAYCRDACPVCE